MEKKMFAQGIFLLAILSILCAPYLFMNAWWKFILSFIGICFVTIIFDENGWKSRLGFSTARISWQRTLLITLITFSTTPLVLYLVTKHEGISQIKQPFSVYTSMPIFQSLNEEIVLRAILFSICFERRWNTKIYSFVTALVFSGLHILLYSLLEGSVLPISTFLTLFLFSYTMNSIFLASRSILPTFAFHLSWNLFRFQPEWIDKSGNLLSEASSF